MPRKMARSGCQTRFGLAEALMAVYTLYQAAALVTAITLASLGARIVRSVRPRTAGH